jgi:fucose 4-O-acetylase-like acetyltransferase
MISGYLFSNKKSFKDFFKHKFKSLIIPYIFFFIISLIANQLVFDRIGIIKILKAFFLNGKYLNYVHNWALWYLPTFFIVLLLFYPLSKVKNKKLNILIAILFAIITVPTYKICNRIFTDEFMPLTVQAIPAGIFYMYVGNLFKEYQNKIKISDKYKLVISIICFILGILISLKTTKSEILRLSTYRYIATSILLIPLILLLTKDSHNKIILYLGKNSLTILGLHLVLIDLIKRHNLYDILLKQGLSYKYSSLFVAFIVIIIVCLLNELNVYLKKRILKN